MKIIKYFFEFIIIILLFLIFKIVGRKISSELGCFIFKIFGSYFRSKETNIFEFYKKLFLNMGSDLQKKYIEEMWCNFGRTFSEYVYLKQFRKYSRTSYKNKWCRYFRNYKIKK